MKQFRGLGVAMITPFKEDRKIDFPALEKLTNHLIDGGVDYLVVQGTTGETPTLTTNEKKDTLEAVKAYNASRIPIVLGIGSNSTQAVLDDIVTADLNGVDAILSSSPYYNKPTQEGIYQHYKKIAESTSKPIIVYNVPGRTASNLLPATILRLANDFENIIAVKEASGNIEQKAAIICDRPNDFLVISGDDAQVVAEAALGNDGVISVIGNALPMEFKSVIANCLAHNFEGGRNDFYKLFKLIDLLFVEGNPAGVKAALHVLGICEPFVRLPLVEVSQKTYKSIEGFLKGIGY